MIRDPLARVFVAWWVATVLACVVVHRVFALSAGGAHEVVTSVWSGGQLVARRVVDPSGGAPSALDDALALHPDGTRVEERVVAEGPVLLHPQAAFALSFVPGRDGLKVTLAQRTEYLTPDDLLARQVYDKGIDAPSLGFKAGIDATLVLAILSDRFRTTVPDLLDHATFRRVRVERVVSSPPVALPAAAAPAPITPDTLTDDEVRAGVMAAARYLARGVDAHGRFRYRVDAPTNRTLSGYDWPRHAGATYFLAQAAALAHDPQLGQAALRAAAMLRHAVTDCGAQRCVGEGDIVDVGSSALATLAFVEIARTELDPSYAAVVRDLAAFLRSQQRPDGEFMHEYDRSERHPIDVQLLYYTGETALALSRSHALLGDARDLDAASRALAHLVGPGWSFFGSRYYFGEEHWTCQAMDDLWDRAPDAVERRALDFCLRWHAYGRKLQYGEGDTSFDADGAYGLGPIVTPRLTPVGSRCEAGIATLDAAARADLPASERAPLERQLRRSVAMLLRHQLTPGARHLFADPEAVAGAMPASEVDWELRIDFAQHTGSALVRWLSRP